MAQPSNPSPSASEIQALSEVLKEHTTAIKEQAVATQTLVEGVQKDADLREIKVQRLEEQALALQDQTAELRESNERLKKFAKLILTAVVVSIVGTLLTAYLLFQFNQDSQERSKLATEQRTEQLRLSKENQVALTKAQQAQDRNVAIIGFCAKSPTTDTYKQCLERNGFSPPDLR